jgi:hypothetical protein
MRKTVLWMSLAFALIPAAAGAATVGVGVYGGVSIPVLNDLSEQGALFGVRVPVNLLPLLTVEPFFAKAGLGEVEETFGPTTFTRDGGDVTGFGATALLTFGAPTFKLFPFAGIGSYKLERDGAEEISDIGFNFGLGFGLSPIPKLSFDVRGEFLMVTTDETSQKFANVTAGASYAIFSMP